MCRRFDPGLGHQIACKTRRHPRFYFLFMRQRPNVHGALLRGALLYNRDWICRNFIGNISFSQGLFDEERFDAAFVLCMESLNAAILYSSQEEIAALRLRSEYPLLKLCWRTPNCLIFVPQDFGIIEQSFTEKWRCVKTDS